tara:strand:- start:140 stop:325 length:186 start_codon:yes stop_codon:yes gene_type:complete
MSIKVYRIKIEGFVVDQDFGGSLSSQVTPADWGVDTLINEMAGNCHVTETLVDTIEDEDKA